MKLHFTYNLPDLSQALKIAEQTAEFADILGVGSLLFLKEGINAVQTFKKNFPEQDIFAESNIVEKAQDAVKMLADAGASYVSILAGSQNPIIKKGVDTARSVGIKVALNLLDSPSFGQSAMDAKMLEVNYLILNRIPGSNDMAELEAELHSIRANSSLPIFITGRIDEKNFQNIATFKPYGMMVGTAITKASNPAELAKNLQSFIKQE